MTATLSSDDVRHVARLARLRLSDDEIETMRRELDAVVHHLATLDRLDLEGVEPLAHPLDVTNRLDPDEPRPGLGPDVLLDGAPVREGDFIAVPKVIDDGGGGA